MVKLAMSSVWPASLGDEARGRRRALGEDPLRIERALHRLDDVGTGVEGAQARGEHRRRVVVCDVGLRDHDAVGEDHLAPRLGEGRDRLDAALRGDHGDDRLDVKLTAERAVGGEGGEDRRGIGEPAGLDDDALEMRDDAALAVGDEAVQRDLQVRAHVAAQAAIAEQRDVVAGIAQQHVVDAGLTELVDDDGGAGPLRGAEELPHQCGFSGAQKPGHDGDGNPRAPLALEPAPERPGGGGGEEFEHGLGSSCCHSGAPRSGEPESDGLATRTAAWIRVRATRAPE